MKQTFRRTRYGSKKLPQDDEAFEKVEYQRYNLSISVADQLSLGRPTHLQGLQVELRCKLSTDNLSAKNNDGGGSTLTISVPDGMMLFRTQS